MGEYGFDHDTGKVTYHYGDGFATDSDGKQYMEVISRYQSVGICGRRCPPLLYRVCIYDLQHRCEIYTACFRHRSTCCLFLS